MDTQELLKSNNISVLKADALNSGIKTFEIDKNVIVEASGTLKQQFDMLISIFAIDNVENFEVKYHFYSTITKENTILICFIDRNSPNIDSISGLYKTADWHERETFDLFGIVFNNHPNLKRLLLPSDWIGHPLRKDYIQNDKRLAWNER